MASNPSSSADITQISDGTITSPPGFSAGGVFIGLKSRGEDKLDLALLVSDTTCSVGGVFTTSSIRSATVDLDRERVARGQARALIVNAGIANTCVGPQGYKDAEEMTRLAANTLGLTAEDVLVCSTGVIGVELPMSLIRSGVTAISLDASGGNQLARAMMTTDTHPKETAVSFTASTGQTITIGGVAKGSGMIHPNMATMLSFAATDAAVDPGFLQTTVKAVADETYNMLTVDGDSSTNDTFLAFANGQAGNPVIDDRSPDAPAFRSALHRVCTDLTRMLARDGEGASRLITVQVDGARSDVDARKAAKTIAGSNLVKSAVYGADPNWGRLMMALGRSGAEAVEEHVDLFVNGVCIMEAGTPIPFHRDAVVALMSTDQVDFRVSLNLADGAATAFGCDLTEQYVIINSAYTT
jgi:glutamate N-acetyltransferase/amino-acid N-acetyltransferase